MGFAGNPLFEKSRFPPWAEFTEARTLPAKTFNIAQVLNTVSIETCYMLKVCR